MQTVLPTAAISDQPVVWRQIKQELARDRLIYALAGLYLVGGWAVFVYVGKTERFLPLMYLPFWVVAAIHCVLIFLLAFHVPRAIKDGSRRPLTDAVLAASRQISLPRFVAGFILLSVNATCWGVFSSIKNILPALAPLWSDRVIADLDFTLHGSNDPWRLLHSIIRHQAITRVLEILYLNVWLLILAAFPLFLAFRRDADGLRLRYFATSFVILIVLGNGLAAAGMSAGPVYYGHVTGDYERFSELVAYLSFSKGHLSSAADIQDHLWRLLSTHQEQLGSGISALPSIHVAMATLFFLAGSRLNRKLGAVLLVYLIVVLIGSVHLGWHYGLDGYVSLLATVVIWRVVGALQRLPAKRDARAACPG